MANPYIIFNGISSEDLGFVVEQLPDTPRPKRNYEDHDIPGRDGGLIADLGGYEAYTAKIKLNAFGHPLSDVYGWLRGEGWLTTSDDPEYMRWVAFFDQIEDSRFRAMGRCYDSLTIPGRFQPCKHLVKQDVLELAEAQVFSGQGTEPASPVIEITGTGSINLMVNESTVLIDNLSGTLTIDCDARTAYTVDAQGQKVFAGRLVTLLDGWPTLLPEGEVHNRVNWSGDVSLVKITPWWRWL